jgi:hypothetical protein
MLVLIFAIVVMNFLTTHTTVVAENFSLRLGSRKETAWLYQCVDRIPGSLLLKDVHYLFQQREACSIVFCRGRRVALQA